MTIIGKEHIIRASKPVNVFDLTSKSKAIPRDISQTYSAKEKAARITLFILLAMVVSTALYLLFVETFRLHWAFCSKSHKKSSLSYRKDDGPVSLPQAFKDHWDTLSVPEKRKELLRVTLGETDLYDMYGVPPNVHFDSEENT